MGLAVEVEVMVIVGEVEGMVIEVVAGVTVGVVMVESSRKS